MILTTDELMAERRALVKQLRETATEGAELTLTYDGPAPSWAQFGETVTLMHRGQVAFTGKVVRIPGSESAGEAGQTTVTVRDFFWLLERQTLGAQVESVMAAAGSGGSALSGAQTMRGALNSAMQSWVTLAASCRLETQGWTVTPQGVPHRADSIGLNTAAARYSFGRYMDTSKAMTTLDAMLCMRQANPDCLLLPDYIAGQVRVVALGNTEELVWDTQRVGILAEEEIAQDFEHTVTGVAVAVTYQGTGDRQQVRVAMYPPGLAADDMGVKLFTVSAPSAGHSAEQLAFALKQARAYYEAANEVQYTGSITAALADVEASPLGKRLSITGRGSRPEWAGMRAIVSEVLWDFTEKTVAATLGFTVEEPQIAELQWDEYDPGGGGDGGDDPGPDPQPSGDDDDTGTGGGGAFITAEVEKAVEHKGEGKYDLTLTAVPTPAGQYAYTWKLDGQTGTKATAVFKGLEYGKTYNFTLGLRNTITRESTTLTGSVCEEWEPLTLTVEDAAADVDAHYFDWRLAWLTGKEVSRTTVEIDNGDPVEVQGKSYTARVLHGVHTARVEVETAAGETAAQVVTTSYMGEDDPTPPYNPVDPDNPPAADTTDGSGVTDDFGVWAEEEPALGRDTYTMMLTARTTRGGSYSYVWMVAGKTYTGQTATVPLLEYGTSYRYTLVAEDTVTGKKARADGTFEQRKETSIPCVVQVTASTPPGSMVYSADIIILSTYPGAEYKITITGGQTMETKQRSARLNNLRYGVEYRYTATVTLPAPNSQGLTKGESFGFIIHDAPDDPTPPTPVDPDTPPDGPDNPPTGGTHTGGTHDTPTGGADVTELERRVAELERRVAELEQQQGTCECDCAGIVAAVEAALNAAVQRAVQEASQAAAGAAVMAVAYSDSLVQEVESTNTGTLRAKTKVTGVTAAGGGSAETSIGYNV